MSDGVASCSNSRSDTEARTFKNDIVNNDDLCVDSGSTNRIPNTFFKLWIYDIITALASPIRKHTILFKSRPVDFVIIFGTITKVMEFSTKIIFELDDCTGNISCVCYLSRLEDQEIPGYAIKTVRNNRVSKLNKNETKKREPESKKDIALKNCFEWLEKEINRSERKILKSAQSFKLGETVCVKGAIKHFHGHREIRVFTFYKIDNLIDESTLIMEKVHLYTNEYNI